MSTTTAPAKTTPKAPPYGCDAAYVGPALPELLRLDYHGWYVREVINLTTGRVLTDADGAVALDRIAYPTRRHMDLVAKGWRLLELV